MGVLIEKMVIIQARMTSTRLPGKVLLPLCEKPALQVMIERLEAFSENLIIATTDDGSEAPIVELCGKLGIPSFRGSSEDVLDRYYQCAKHFGAREETVVVRLTSDCPLMDSSLLQVMLERFSQDKHDYFSNIQKRTYPRGLDIEMMRFETLRKAHQEATEPFEREHVTPFIYKSHPELFRIGSHTDAEDFSHFRLTLDVEEDYTVLKNIYTHFGCQLGFPYGMLICALVSHPELTLANRTIAQKKI